jgi:hypothetical protein
MTKPSLLIYEYWCSLSYLMKALLMASFLNGLIDNGGEGRIGSISLSPHLSEELLLLGVKTNSQIKAAIVNIVPASNAACMLKGKG